MIECLCLVQAGQTADQKQAELSALVNGFTQRSFGEEAQISWIPVPAGSFFTAAEPSTASVISVTANQPLEQSRREALLKELSQLWADQTGCTLDELVTAISNPAAS